MVSKLFTGMAARALGPAARGLAREAAAEARRQYAARAAARAAEPPPATGSVARVVFGAWVAGLAAFVLVVLNVDLLLPDGAAVSAFRLVVGGWLVALGAALVADRLPVRRLLADRLARRTRGGRRRFVGGALSLLGVAWVATGVLELLRGLDVAG
ncbi:MAG TPA: hypothetical protein VFB26_05125 [Gaiellaceae bacterium]|nr:hypothetical protein [Gaiellaceae bacterium]